MALKESTLSEITEIEGGGLCYTWGPFPYYVGPGDVCVTIHIAV